MKVKTSKKSFKGYKVLRVYNEGLHHLLKNVDPFSYSAGIYGWSCDYYNIDDVIISTGYDPIGIPLNREKVSQYEEIARSIFDNNQNSYNEKMLQLDSLLKDFIHDPLIYN